MFRHHWAAGSLNDNGDGTIAIAILEHWFRVFAEQAASWRAPEWY